MKLLLKNARVVDPRGGIDGAHDLLVEDGRVALARKTADGFEGVGARPRRPRRLPRLHRHARPPPRARVRMEGDDRQRHQGGRGGRIHRRRVHAEHGAADRLPVGRGIRSGPGAAARDRPGLSDRLRLQRAEGCRACRDGRHGGGGRARLLRRRQARRVGRTHAPGARVRAHLRSSRDRPLRRADARRGRRRARGRDRHAPRPAGMAGGRRGRDGAARHLARGVHGRGGAHRAHVHGAIGRTRESRQGRRHPRHVRGDAASLRA